jgi:chloramphenicol 3-O phosphotransferase
MTDHMAAEPTQVIMLNGGSSSGKTGIARCLQAILPGPWLRLSVDDFVEALPPSLLESDAGIGFGQQGEVTIGGGFRELKARTWPGPARIGGWFVTVYSCWRPSAITQHRSPAHRHLRATSDRRALVTSVRSERRAKRPG